MTFFLHIQGYVSYRRKGVGSWFFHNLIKVFRNNYQDEHVEEMLTYVKQLLAYDEEWKTLEGCKQMPCTWSTMTKHFYLT